MALSRGVSAAYRFFSGRVRAECTDTLPIFIVEYSIDGKHGFLRMKVEHTKGGTIEDKENGASS